MAATSIPNGRARHMGLAVVAAFLLSAAWSWGARAELAALLLPDTDDVMRLVQVRDWLEGQPFRDLVQYRLGGGVPMHWSRLGDFGPAALILMLRPVFGAHGAEVAAVIAWPAMLFAAALYLLGRIARALGGPGSGWVAVALGALAYPMTGIFMPGRIDHHGLQLVIVLAMVRALVGSSGWRSGIAIGVAAAASIAIGLETAPLVAAVLGLVMLRWIGDPAAHARLAGGAGAALALGTALATAALRPRIWPAELCDGFTPPLAIAAALAGLVMTLCVAVGGRGETMRVRLSLTVLAGVGTILFVAATQPICLAGPYAAVDPRLVAAWLSRVEEARPLLALAPPQILAFAGLMFAGLAASLAAIRYAPARRADWLMLLIVQLAALATALIQLRAANFGTALAVPALAWAVAQLRQRRFGAMAWLFSAGITYPIAAQAMAPGSAAEPPRAECRTAANRAALGKLPRATLMAPIDLGPDALAAGPVIVVAAPYHRNNGGNLASYRFFLGPEAEARAIAQARGVRFVAFCPGWLADLDPGDRAAPDSVRRRVPGWLKRHPASTASLAVYEAHP